MASQILDTINAHKNNIVQALPTHIPPERFYRLALTTLRRTPKLQETSPESFVGAVLAASALGLEPDVAGECYLVPRKRETTLIVGYQGLVKLFWQHPLAAGISSQYVCERDHFEYEYGTAPRIVHRPAVGDRGDVIAYYATVSLKTGASWFEVFTPAQIAALRGTTRPGSIPDPEHWMARKTALKQVLKLAPKSTELWRATQVDEQPQTLESGIELAASVREREPEPQPAQIEAQQPDRDERDPWAEHVDPQTGEVIDAEIVEARR